MSWSENDLPSEDMKKNEPNIWQLTFDLEAVSLSFQGLSVNKRELQGIFSENQCHLRATLKDRKNIAVARAIKNGTSSQRGRKKITHDY